MHECTSRLEYSSEMLRSFYNLDPWSCCITAMLAFSEPAQCFREYHGINSRLCNGSDGLKCDMSQLRCDTDLGVRNPHSLPSSLCSLGHPCHAVQYTVFSCEFQKFCPEQSSLFNTSKQKSLTTDSQILDDLGNVSQAIVSTDNTVCCVRAVTTEVRLYSVRLPSQKGKELSLSLLYTSTCLKKQPSSHHTC